METAGYLSGLVIIRPRNWKPKFIKRMARAWISVGSVAALTNAAGKAIGTVSIMLDVTRQKMAERRIRESENKIRIILDNSAAAITLTDEEERIVSWNKFTEILLGKSKEDLYLKHISTLYPQEEWEEIRRRISGPKGLETYRDPDFTQGRRTLRCGFIRERS